MKKVFSIILIIITIFTCCLCLSCRNKNIETEYNTLNNEKTYSITKFIKITHENENKIIQNYNVVDDPTTPDNKPDIVINKNKGNTDLALISIISLFVIVIIVALLFLFT